MTTLHGLVRNDDSAAIKTLFGVRNLDSLWGSQLDHNRLVVRLSSELLGRGSVRETDRVC